MADVIGSLAYKLRLDSTQFKEGMAATRGEFASAKAIALSSATGLDVYSKAAQNLDVLMGKGLINLAQHGAAKEKLTQQHLEQEAYVRRLTAAELAHLKTLRDASAATKTTAQDESARSRILQRSAEITEQTRSAQSRLNRELAEARKLYREGAISAGTYAKHVAEIKKKAAGPGMLAGVGGKALGAAAAITGGMSVIGVGRDAIKMTADIERAQAAMEAFTGSGAKAATMLDEIRKLSSVAGIGFRGLNEGATAMMGYGVSTEVTTAKLRQFAEISRGDTDRFKSLALAFGQVNAAGRLMGQEVLQMVNAGFNPLQEIARTTGIEFSTLKKMMENGQVSVDMVSKAFDTATSAGGRFNGMLAEIGTTSAGAISRMSAEWEKFLDTFGESMPAKEGAKAVTEGIKGSTMFVGELDGFYAGNSDAWRDAVSMRMEQAKERPRVGSVLGKEAERSNALDQQIARTNFTKEIAREEKLRAEQKAADEARKKRLQTGVDGLKAARQSSQMEFHQQNDPQAFKQFNRIESMLEGPKKKQASEDFAKFGNINRILPLLDRELQIEVNKLDYLERQNAARLKGTADLLKDEDKKRKSKLEGPAKTAAGLTREQHEMTSYSSYGAAMQGEGELRKAEMMQQQEIARVEQLKRNQLVAEQLPDIERQRQLQAQSHSPAANISVGSQEAYKLMTANKTRADAKNDPQVKKMDQFISEAKNNVTAVNKVAEKLDFEMVGQGR